MILYISSETWAVPAVSMKMVKVFAGQSLSDVVKKFLMVFYYTSPYIGRLYVCFPIVAKAIVSTEHTITLVSTVFIINAPPEARAFITKFCGIEVISPF